jgi:hypothetical protein
MENKHLYCIPAGTYLEIVTKDDYNGSDRGSETLTCWMQFPTYCLRLSDTNMLIATLIVVKGFDDDRCL